MGAFKTRREQEMIEERGENRGSTFDTFDQRRKCRIEELALLTLSLWVGRQTRVRH